MDIVEQHKLEKQRAKAFKDRDAANSHHCSSIYQNPMIMYKNNNGIKPDMLQASLKTQCTKVNTVGIEAHMPVIEF